jgi:uncharacterized membrane protein
MSTLEHLRDLEWVPPIQSGENCVDPVHEPGVGADEDMRVTMKADVDARALLLERDVKRSRVRLLVTIVLVGTLVSIVWHYVSGFYLGQGYPRSTFLFVPADHFNDWNNVYTYAQEFLRGVPGPFGYFPFAILAAVTTTVLPTSVGFILMVVLFLGLLALMLRRWVLDCEEHALTRAQGMVILIGLSYPVLFVLDRGNMEMLVFAFIAGFFYFTYVRECRWMAALCLAAAIAFKLYPATLLLLLLAERRFKLLVLTVVIAGGLTAISVGLLAVVGHYSLADVWQMNAGGKGNFQQGMVIDGAGVDHGHSLWGLVGLWTMLRQAAVLSWKTTLYAVAAAAIFLGLVVHAVFRETERWKLVLLATVPALLLPYVSFDYTLIQLYFPLVFFLNSRRVSRWDVVYVALFGILLVPVDYYYIPGIFFGRISISVIIYPVALVALVLLAILDVQRTAGHVNGEHHENRGSRRWTRGRGVRSPVDADEPGLIRRPPAAEHRRFRRRGRVLPPAIGGQEPMLRGSG